MDPRVTELHCIMPEANVISVTEHGIMSYERASKIKHRSVALQPIQDKRDKIQVPRGMKLHHYANLYFHARNPMMYKRRGEAICVLRVSTDILQLDGTVISDQNAASDYVRFYHPSQWELLNFDDIYALDWRHPGNPIAYYRHRSCKCAEVLVPNCINPKNLVGAYVKDDKSAQTLENLGFELPITVDAVLFFG